MDPGQESKCGGLSCQGLWVGDTLGRALYRFKGVRAAFGRWKALRTKFPHLLAVSAPPGVPVGGQGWLSSNEGETRERRKGRTQALGGLSAIRQDCHVV